MATIELARSHPSAASIHRRIRRWRREKQSVELGDQLAMWSLPIFVGTGLIWWLISRESGALAAFDFMPGGAGRIETEFGLGITAIAFAALMKAVAALGPIAIDPTNRHWLFSSPVSRRALLAPRFAATTAAGAIAGLLVVRVSTLVTAISVPWWWCGLVGAALGAGVVGFGVVRQLDRRADSLYRAAILIVVVVGTVCCALSFVLVPTIPSLVVLVLASSAAVVSVIGVALGARCLHRLNLVALSTGSDLATALSVSMIMIDTSVLSAVVTSRKWRLIGAVRSRRFRWGGLKALIEADTWRVRRDHGSVRLLVLLGALPYVIGPIVGPVTLPAVVLLSAVAVASRFGGGLRDVNASSAFRALLGGSDVGIRLAHLVVPAAAVSIVFVACLPILWHTSVLAVAVIPVVALLALYRSTSRPPLDYGGLILETPVGQIPVDILRQLFRGPLVVAAAIAMQLVVEMS